LLLYFSLGLFLKAEIIAGASAPLVHKSYVSQNDIEQLRQRKIKISIESVLKRYDSPMSKESDAFVKTCIKYQIDCYLLPAIAGLESTFGKFIYPNSYNPFGWGRGYTMFSNWSEDLTSSLRD